MSQLNLDFEAMAGVVAKPRGERRPGAWWDGEVEAHGLRMALIVAVPLWIAKLRDVRADHRRARAVALASLISTRGDGLQWRSKGGSYSEGMKKEDDSGRNYGTAELFNAFAEGLACIAYESGGARFRDMHWEARA